MMKLKEAFPDLDDTLFDRPIRQNKKPPFKPTATAPFSREDLEIVVDKMPDGFFRATIRSVRGEKYGSKPSHPKEFMAPGRTPEQAKEELFKKLKI